MEVGPRRISYTALFAVLSAYYGVCDPTYHRLLHFFTSSPPPASPRLYPAATDWRLHEGVPTMHESLEPSWDIRFSELNKLYYSSLLSIFSLASTMVVHPLIVLTVRRQAAASAEHPAKHTLSSTYHELGWRGLYRGCLPLAIMGMPSSIVYFAAYESSRELVHKELVTIFPHIDPTSLDFIQAASSSIFCNSLSLLFYVPAELVSSRMIIQPRDGLGMVGMIRRVRSERGLKGFFRGYSPSLVTAVLSSSVWWSAYNICRRSAHLHLDRGFPQTLDAFSGLVAGVSSVVVGHPFDTLKTRIMTGISKDRSMVINITRLIYSRELSTLWKGFTPNLFQTAITSSGFAVMYETIKRLSSN